MANSLVKTGCGGYLRLVVGLGECGSQLGSCILCIKRQKARQFLSRAEIGKLRNISPYFLVICQASLKITNQSRSIRITSAN